MVEKGFSMMIILRVTALLFKIFISGLTKTKNKTSGKLTTTLIFIIKGLCVEVWISEIMIFIALK